MVGGRLSPRGARAAGAAVGLVAAGAAAGLAAERYAVGRLRRRRDPAAAEPFDRLPADRVRVVPADDGVPLHVEEVGDPAAPLTVVFVHGWVLRLGSWHYQRAALATEPGVRLVFADLRHHGRSGHGAPEHATIDWLARDLAAVIRAVAPDGPVALVGHSLGGMTILALAAARPELFGSVVCGVALVATSAGKLAAYTLGLPAAVAQGVRRVAPGTLATLSRHSGPVQRVRTLGSDLGWLVTRWYAFGPGPMSPSVVGYVDDMIASTPIDVVADFYAALMAHDVLHALPTLGGVPTVIVCGDRDRLTPPDHSRAMAQALPSARLVLVPGAGHLVLLERPDAVNAALVELIRRVAERRDPSGRASAAG